jgi:hydrogenase maturation protein HypF
MCDCLATARRFCHVSRAEAALLSSVAAPIALLAKRPRPQLTLSPLIAPGNNRYGVMFPYTPMHALLFRELRRQSGKPAVLIMTSANRKDAPITVADEEIVSELGNVVDIILTHDRPIANRCDDSVILVHDRPCTLSASPPAPGSGIRRTANRADQAVLPIRLARGYAPVVVQLDPMFHVKHPTLGVGGDTRNCLCIAAADRAFVGPHIGDLGSVRAEGFFMEVLERLLAWTGIKPELVACDLHPDYFSTRLAEQLAGKRHLPLVRIQHHLAHTVSAIAESGTTGRVLGLALDGTGYGTDGATWGCEFLLVEPDLSWKRVGHLGYLRLPATGDTVPDPGLIAATYLAQATDSLGPIGPLTSSLGRLFDAVAGLTGICRKASFDGQAAIALETAADEYLMNGKRGSRTATLPAGLGRPRVSWSNGAAVIEPVPIIRQVASDLGSGKGPKATAARFHLTVSRALVAAALGLARMYRVHVLALSGGAVQNSLLRNALCSGLSRHGLRVVCSRTVPVNDGGICLGQAVSAGRR